MGQEIKDRFSGAVEAFARKSTSASGQNGEPARHRTLKDALASTKEVAHLSFLILIESLKLLHMIGSFATDCLTE